MTDWMNDCKHVGHQVFEGRGTSLMRWCPKCGGMQISEIHAWGYPSVSAANATLIDENKRLKALLNSSAAVLANLNASISGEMRLLEKRDPDPNPEISDEPDGHDKKEDHRNNFRLGDWPAEDDEKPTLSSEYVDEYTYKVNGPFGELVGHLNYISDVKVWRAAIWLPVDQGIRGKATNLGGDFPNKEAAEKAFGLRYRAEVHKISDEPDGHEKKEMQ